MAKRPSVSEIIAAVRAAGPARPDEVSEAVDSAPTRPEPGTGAEDSTAIQETPDASSSPAATPSPSTPGRPLTLKEKLAAAKNRPAGAEPPSVASSPAPESVEASAEEPAPAEPAADEAPAPAPVPTGRPLTLQEKLAAARARPAGASPAPSGAKPAAKASPAAKPVVAKGAARSLPPLEKMTDPRDLAEALRRTGAERKPKASEPAAKAAAPRKPTPSKAVPPRPTREAASTQTITEADRPDEVRRGVLAGVVAASATWVMLGWASFVGGLLAFTAMLGRFMFPNVLAEPPSSIKVGLPSDFEPEMVNEDFKAEWGFWMVRSTSYDGVDKIYAIQTVCTHLGCPPNWLPSEQKFKCPCHGSGFYISGVNFEGPAPRPLERFRVVLADDGQILVDKSQKYQEELGQWTDPDSFIPV